MYTIDWFLKERTNVNKFVQAKRIGSKLCIKYLQNDKICLYNNTIVFLTI